MCPSWRGSVAPTGPGVDPNPWVSSGAGIPLGAVGLCSDPQRLLGLGQDSGVPVDSLVGRKIYPGKWEQKMLLGASGSSSCFLLASPSPGIHVTSQ